MKKSNNSNLKDTPVIPQDVYKNLPEALKRCCHPFSDERERDIILTSTIAAISSCLPNVFGDYDGKKVWTNIYMFIVAPPSSAKGLANYADTLVLPIHKFLRERSLNEELNSKGRNGLKIECNASSAAFLKRLSDYGEKGFLFDSEADTLANALKQDWGDYSAMLRKSFHHESISSVRKKDNEDYEIYKPKLSILLTGTLDQIKGVIKSADNGLFSRFSFYTFTSDVQWKNVGPSSTSGRLEEHFEKIGEQLLIYYKYLENKNIEFVLSEEDWDRLNSSFCHKLTQASKIYDENSLSIVKRHGLILFRVSMILSALRMFENGEENEIFTVSDIDFNTAFIITSICFQHSLRIFEQLPGTVFEPMPDNKRRFLDELLKLRKFKRSQAISLGVYLGLCQRTADNYLQSFKNLYFTSPIYGEYEIIDT